MPDINSVCHSEKGNNVTSNTNRFRLYTAVFLVNLLYLPSGCVLTWPSPNLGHLDLDQSQGSWVGSVMALGAMVGPPLNVTLGHLVGRRGNLFLNALLFGASFTLLAASKSVAVILVARFLGGIAVGLSFNTIPVYLTEVADDKVRQAVTSLTELFIGFGYLIEYGLGPITPYRILQVIPVAMVLGIMVSLYWMPETPYYLLSQDKEKEAISSLCWLRSKPKEEVQQEILIIKNCIKEQLNQKQPSLMEQFSKRGHRKAFILSFLCLSFQTMSGIAVIPSFAEQILETTPGLPISSSQGALIFGLMNLLSSAFAPPLVKRFGTKLVLIACTIIISISHILFAVYTYLISHNVSLPSLSLLPVILLVVCNIVFCIGLGPLPWSVLAELSPPDFRGFTTASNSTISWLISFAQMLAFLPASKAFGIWAVFLFFGVISVIGALVVAYFLPNTKGMSLLSIQELLNKGNHPLPLEKSANRLVIESSHI